MHSQAGTISIHYRPQTKLRKGNVFTPVCQSFCSRGVCLSAYWDTPTWTHTPGQTPPPPLDTPSPWADTPSPPPSPFLQTATAADGTHPTGMQFLLKVCSQVTNFRSIFSLIQNAFHGMLG